MQGWNVPDFHLTIWSQSFIHQVRILSYISPADRLAMIKRCRNPLFIKSEFSLLEGLEFYGFSEQVAILYSSSQNSLYKKSKAVMAEGDGSRNPLFIKSEFSLSQKIKLSLTAKCNNVAILYSSSQNSLN